MDGCESIRVRKFTKGLYYVSVKPFFVAIEGVDGVGKATQVALLQQYLRGCGRVHTIAFPQYHTPGAYFVEAYLSGKFGPPESVHPKAASTFYALDRYAAAEGIREWIASGSTVIADRYVGSNLAHQGGKISDEDTLKRFVEWDLEFEFDHLKIPRPLCSVILWVPVYVSLRRLVARGNTLDGHEKDVNHLTAACRMYSWLAEQYPHDFVLVSCVSGDRELTPEEVHEKILSVLRERVGI